MNKIQKPASHVEVLSEKTNKQWESATQIWEKNWSLGINGSYQILHNYVIKTSFFLHMSRIGFG